MRQRISRDFEVRGSILRLWEGQNKTGGHYVGMVVGGFTFFPPEELWPALGELEQGDLVSVRGESVGETVRNGQRQPQFELYEIVPDVEVEARKASKSVLKAAAAASPSEGVAANGSTIPRSEK